MLSPEGRLGNVEGGETALGGDTSPSSSSESGAAISSCCEGKGAWGRKPGGNRGFKPECKDMILI